MTSLKISESLQPRCSHVCDDRVCCNKNVFGNTKRRSCGKFARVFLVSIENERNQFMQDLECQVAFLSECFVKTPFCSLHFKRTFYDFNRKQGTFFQLPHYSLLYHHYLVFGMDVWVLAKGCVVSP